MRLIKELIHRRIPHIIGSYLIAGTSLILFVDWLINRYSLPEYYTTLCLFAVIAIMPSVIILAYFHGAPGKDQWTKIEKIGVPINIIFIFLVLLIGHRSNWWFDEVEDKTKRTIYIDISSYDGYIKYYKDINSPYDQKYVSNNYIISSMKDSILTEIKHAVFRNVSSEYSGHDLIIDMGFDKIEIDAFNTLYTPRIMKLSVQQIDTLNKNINNIIKILNNRIDYYGNKMPDALIRYFIYKVENINNNKFYFAEQAVTWGSDNFRENTSVQYTSWGNKYDMSPDGIAKLIDSITKSANRKISELRYPEAIVGYVIEELDNKMVRIKQKYLGRVKKKMLLGSKREYVWSEGGIEKQVEDLKQVVDYLKNNDIKTIWNYYNSDSIETKVFNFEESKNDIKEAINNIEGQISEIEENRESNYYKNTHSIDTDQFSYTMEVIAVEDSIVIAKVINSRQPVYRIRKNDMIFISK